jgi:predicted PhzF superfamily epimerase YddE/YHI9
MQIDKGTILDLLRERGQQDQASQAEQELPDQVDTEQHADLLQRFGLDPQELLQRFMGGGGMPKL